MSIKTIVDFGFEGVIADIECRVTQGLPSIIIVGFASRAVGEAGERIRGAFDTLPVDFPKRRIAINLAPADIPKQHASFDLAIAVAILEASQAIPPVNSTYAFFGELGLDGTLRPVRGLVGKLLTARKAGIKTVFVPENNGRQAELIEDLQIYELSCLADAYDHFRGSKQITQTTPITDIPIEPEDSGSDFSSIVEQYQAKRALVIAAAGKHNVILTGPPGTGKSMLAKAFTSILPPMSRNEVLEATHIHSLYGRQYEKPIFNRPFRTPHHSASDVAIVGGGQSPRPGEISLAHTGVLFFDEFPEFKRPVIEALRQPLEDHTITLSRTNHTVQFPADFSLVATANPCPCGHYGTSKTCTCPPDQLHRYHRKLSGPIIDRIDVWVNVENIEHTQLLDHQAEQLTSRDMRSQVVRAVAWQHRRFRAARRNASMNNKELKRLAHLGTEAKSILDKAAKNLQLSPRSYMRTLKVARTIADLDESDTISADHIKEALQYRPANQLPS